MVHRDHPRVCGETVCCLICQLYAVGSPPRMRGNALGLCRPAAAPGITPAYAGKRHVLRQVGVIVGDHPRVCGETRSRFSRPQDIKGSPPHMRGKAGGCHPNDDAERITPAYAGKSNRRNGA